jgi:hypothetical protein
LLVEERNPLRRDLVVAALESKAGWPDFIEEARTGPYGLALVEIAPGLVRVEDPVTSEALKRILKRNAGRS